MTPAPVLLRTLTATAAVLSCSLATAAGARANSIVWDSPADQAPASISPAGEDAIVSDGVLAAPDGSVLAMWGQSDPGDSGRVRARASRRSPAGEWSAPEWVSPAGTDLAGVFSAVDDDSNFTIGWIDTTLTPSTRTLRHDESRWDEHDPVVLTSLEGASGESLTGGAITRGPDGTVIGAYAEVSGQHRIRTLTRARNTNDWTRGPDINVGSGEYPVDLKLSVNPAGDVTLLWTRDDGNKDLRASQRPAGSSSWSEPQTIVENAGGDFHFLGLATGPQQDAAVAWQSGDGHIYFTTFSDAVSDGPDDPSVPPVALNTHDPDTDAVETAVLPNIASNGDGRYTVVFQRNPVSPQAFARTRAADGTWSDPVAISGAIGGGAPKLAANPRGDVLAVFAYTLDGSTFLWGSSTLASGSDTWTPATPIGLGSDLDNGSHGLLSAAIDDDGNTAFAFPKRVDSHFEVGFAAGDGAGPRLPEPTLPASGTVGDDLSFSVGAPFDLRSPLGETRWDFGDGASATGLAPHHSYSEPGTYTVTVTASDAVGNTTVRTGTVVVAAAPVVPPVRPPVRPPVVAAPPIEALLAGKRVTMNVKVVLRKGSRCSGRITATTVFGTTTYRASLKLTASGSECRAIGTITLKKAPSLRTKLRVSIRGRTTQLRTVTTKRS